MTKGERRLRRRATEEDDLARVLCVTYGLLFLVVLAHFSSDVGDELSAKQSARILKVAREQLMEEDEEADRQGVVRRSSELLFWCDPTST